MRGAENSHHILRLVDNLLPDKQIRCLKFRPQTIEGGNCIPFILRALHRTISNDSLLCEDILKVRFAQLISAECFVLVVYQFHVGQGCLVAHQGIVEGLLEFDVAFVAVDQILLSCTVFLVGGGCVVEEVVDEFVELHIDGNVVLLEICLQPCAESAEVNGNGLEDHRQQQVVFFIVVHVRVDELLDRLHLFERAAVVDLRSLVHHVKIFHHANRRFFQIVDFVVDSPQVVFAEDCLGQQTRKGSVRHSPIMNYKFAQPQNPTDTYPPKTHPIYPFKFPHIPSILHEKTSQIIVFQYYYMSLSMGKLLLLGVFVVCSFSLYEGNSAVKLLNEQTFPKMLKSKGVWLVEFFSPQCGHCVQAAPEFEKGASIVEGIIHFAAVDMSKHPSLGSQYGIRGYPTFKLFADNKDSPSDYQGQRTAQDFVQFCLTSTKEIITKRANRGQGTRSEQKGSQSRAGGAGGRKSGAGGTTSGGVIVLDDSNFQEKVLRGEEAWFVEFYSPSCGHCQQLAPEWEKLPALMKDKVRIAKYDASSNQQFAQKYQIKGFPTMILFPVGSNKDKTVNYEGQRSAQQMASWLNNQKIGEEKRQLLEFSQEAFNKECQRSNVCLLFLLDSKSELGSIKFLKQTMKKHISEPVRYFYTAKKLSDLENDLLIADRSSPKMIAVWPSSNSYRVYNGEFSSQGVEEFISSKLFGTRGWIKFAKKHQDYLFSPSASSDL